MEMAGAGSGLAEDENRLEMKWGCGAGWLGGWNELACGLGAALRRERGARPALGEEEGRVPLFKTGAAKWRHLIGFSFYFLLFSFHW
ncbi:hypothetical protein ACJIZ3_020093 [Penstemon smallii]|uniref:Uncharacterized protein n=1 Tax=Penstemon smallii TaxID=265156 RepID=A0ABD3SHL5_9LAMI